MYLKLGYQTTSTTVKAEHRDRPGPEPADDLVVHRAAGISMRVSEATPTFTASASARYISAGVRRAWEEFMASE